MFEGNGIIKDFPGSYSEYREWSKEVARKDDSAEKTAKPATEKTRLESKPKMTFKERKEFDMLTKELDLLNNEKHELEMLFNSGAVIKDMDSKSKRYNELTDIIDEKELRWLELSEKE